ncbi:hypothetical protein HNP38_001277 [Chryseobacterium defluvii]|uniref:DUF5050 domain-containing protein n=1 Tax=Chryseobacterium defluvii TaxID=160396 RepID=A0A840KBY9_9FLAO|nr:hypothetical protein [Chryseobacterium defluvii]MBB4806005.1 hypothetical protein [Chryseobacterium defluvii]
MKTLILPLLFLLTFFISCRDNDIAETLEKQVASYDVYVSGKESGQLCYWKNGIKHNIANNSIDHVPSKIYISGNDVYIKGRYGYWKNGNYTTYYQAAGLTNQSVIDIFDFYVKNGNIYFVGYTWVFNSSVADKYEFCYWKNGVKTLLFKDISTYNDICTITEFNSDVYVGAVKKENGIYESGYFKNTTFYPLFSSPTSGPQSTNVVSNNDNIYFSTLLFYKNLQTGNQVNIPPLPSGYHSSNIPALDQNDLYNNGSQDYYYKNGNLISSPNFSKPIIKDLKVMDQNVYMIRTDPNDTEFKVYINNVETQTIQNVNFGSGFNNITVVKH